MEPTLDLLPRYLQMARLQWGVLPWALLLLVALSLPRTRRYLAGLGPRGGGAALARILLVVFLAASLLWALSLAWMGDDAYISFRYARNWLEGHGLVYNPGERVEGYTNFLWTALIAGAMALGFAPEHAAIVLSLVSFVLLVLAQIRVVRLLDRGAASKGDTAPNALLETLSLSVLLTCSNYGIASFVTGGLETLFALTLVFLSAEQAERQRYLGAGVLSVAATMARPDHGLFAAFLGLALLSMRTPWRGLLRFSVPWLCLYAPYFALRWLYYGLPLPNTFYAKSGGGAYYSQGFDYLALTALGAGLFGLAPLALSGAWAKRNSLFVRFACLSIAGFGLYLARVGGDFMYLRMTLVLLPLLFVLADVGHRFAVKRYWPLAVVGAALTAVAFMPVRMMKGREMFHHVAIEAHHYPLGSLFPPRVSEGYVDVGEALAEAFAQSPSEHERERLVRGPRIALGNIGIIGWISNLPVFDTMGLTELEVARNPLRRRGRPGHEKGALVTQILGSDTLLSNGTVYPYPFSELAPVRVGPWWFHLTRWDTEAVRALMRAPHTRLIANYEDHLKKVLAGGVPLDAEGQACERWHQSRFYFAPNQHAIATTGSALDAHAESQAPKDASMAPLMWTRALRWVGQSTPDLQGLEALGYEHVSPEALGYRLDKQIGFSKSDAWQNQGAAFAVLPSHGARHLQMPLLSPDKAVLHQGLANSYTDAHGDRDRGVLLSAPFELQGDLMTLWVGGGRHSKELYVALEIDGVEMYRATGCSAEILGRRAWPLERWKGQQARLRIVDAGQSGWGHILVGGIQIWSRHQMDGG